MLAAVLCVPLALVVALRAPIAAPLAAVVDGLVGAAVLVWSIVTFSLVRLVVHELRVGDVEAGPMGWAAVRVATLVLLVAPFLDSSGPHQDAARTGSSPRGVAVATMLGPARGAGASIGVASAVPAPTVVRHGPSTPAHVARDPRRCRQGPAVPIPLGSGALLVPLAADVRRRARLGRRIVVDGEDAIDVETSLLGCGPPATPLLAGTARALAAAGRLLVPVHVVVTDGEARLDDESWQFDPAGAQCEVRCLVVVLGEEGARTHVLLVPRGATLDLAGPGAASLVDDAVRVGASLGLGRPVRATAGGLARALALRDDDELVVCVGDPEKAPLDVELADRCVTVVVGPDPIAHVTDGEATLRDGRVLDRSALAPAVRALLDGAHDRPATGEAAVGPSAAEDERLLDDRGVVVRLLSEVPHVDGLLEPFEPGRERRAVELLAYLALRAGTPVTGERLRVRVFGTASTDAAAKTLFNAASCLRRSLGDGPFGPRLPPAGRLGRYAVAPDVLCDVAVLEARVRRSRRCEDPEEQMAWLRAALELVQGEPFATVLDGYDWFLAEGHLDAAPGGLRGGGLRARRTRRGPRVPRARVVRTRARDARRPPRRGARRSGSSGRRGASGQLGGDGAGGAQHRAVRTRRHVAVRRDGARLGDEVVQQLEEPPRRVDEQVARQ